MKTNKEIYINNGLTGVVFLIIFYAIISIILWEFNPILWTTGGHFIFLALTLLVIRMWTKEVHREKVQRDINATRERLKKEKP